VRGYKMIELSESKRLKRPSKEVLEKYRVNVKSDSSFRANARSLQSIWRIENFKDALIGKDDRNLRDLGNMLPLKFAQEGDNRPNFLNEGITKIVMKAIDESKITRAKIMEPRIWNNLLSSQPLCFNLFAELSINLNLAKEVFSRVFKVEITKVEKIEFEYSPGRSDLRYSNDRSAFDVFIDYESPEGKAFIGIEVKYSEALKDKPSSHKMRYEEITQNSMIFRDGVIDQLKRKPLQQIWRDHLLALSLYKENSDYKKGLFVYLYPQDNIECYQAIKGYINTFREPTVEFSGFYPVTLESFVRTLKTLGIEDDKWVRDFEDRYLNFAKLNS